jgi:hypothetical protein
MPRNAKGLGRTGRKHKKKAAAGPKAQSKISSGEGGPPSSPVPQETATTIDKVAAQSSPAPSVEDDVAEPIRFISLHGPTPSPHPCYADPSWTGYDKVGYRGCESSYGAEKWDPDLPPCVISDQRPPQVFGSKEAALAAAAARELERLLPENFVGDEGAYNEEDEDLARARYKHALRKLAKAFPELEVLVPELCAGLQANQQCTRPCPCGAGLLAKWPWVLQTPQLGFCPGGEWGEDDDEVTTQGKHDWEVISWRTSGSWHALRPVRPMGRQSRHGEAPTTASRGYCTVPR